MIEISIRHRFPEKAGGFHLDVHFSVDDEEPIVFFGHSGSGKTLTLQAIAGLFSPDEGRIVIGGRTVFDSTGKICLPTRKRRLGYLFQDYALFPHLTVRQNIGFALEGKMPLFPLGKEARRRVNDLLEIFEIRHVAGQYPGCISGGQRQRVALARALANQPDVLLLDEPFSALDPLTRKRVRRQCKGLLARFSTPTILITHDPDDVAAFAQNVLLYERGKAHSLLHMTDLEKPEHSGNELLQCLAASFREGESGRWGAGETPP